MKTPLTLALVTIVLGACMGDDQISSIDRGLPIPLDREQRHTVVSGVKYLLPDGGSDARVGDIRASRAEDGTISVCGTAYPGGAEEPRPFFGILTGSFYVWELAKNDGQRNSVQHFCSSAGIR